MKYDGYVAKSAENFERMTKMFSNMADVSTLDQVMLMYLADRTYDRQDILVARERRAEELSK